MTSLPEFIPFNRPFMIGKEMEYISRAVASGHLSGGGNFTKDCSDFFSRRYGISKNILTHSCTGAIELAALLLNIQPGDEVIAPSFSFVSTVNPFVLRGARIIFADSTAEHPNMDAGQVEKLISPKTRAIICVHYAGMACDMEKLSAISAATGIPLIEDAAHAIESKWKDRQLGSIGKFGAFSFHETKNVIAGEGGLLCLNTPGDYERAEILAEKGTNRQAFFRGEVNKYEWMDAGSSFLPSEMVAAYLLAQLEEIEKIQKDRLRSWQTYHELLEPLESAGFALRPVIADYAMTNGHIYYLVCRSQKERNELTDRLKKENIQAVFHYQSLHNSPYYRSNTGKLSLVNADRFSSCLLRLPLFYGITIEQVTRVCSVIGQHFGI